MTVAHAQATVLWSSIVDILQSLCGFLTDIKPLTDIINHEITCQSTERSKEIDSAFTLGQWIAYTRHVPSHHPQRQHLNLSLAIAFLRDPGRQGIELYPAEIESIWSLVRGVLTDSSIISGVSRSAQGFLAVPLWCVTRGGDIEELIRLHVWLPDGKRGNEEIAIHSHQPFAQSWVIAGKGRDHRYDVQQPDSTTATHAKYELSWTNIKGEDTGKIYQVNQKFAKIVNTGGLVQVVETQSEVHSRYTTYGIDAGAFHRSEVQPGEMHATFFFFDAQRGFNRIAPVLGPVTGDEYYQERDSGGMTPAKLAAAVEAFRSWERLYYQGLTDTAEAKVEEALLAHHSALSICDDNPNFPQGTHYRYVALAELGYVYRLLGRFVKASQCLEEAVHDMPRNESRLKALGELSVVYRHLDRFDDCRKACEEQYETAKHMGSEQEMSRAIGNLGMANYQLYLLNNEREYLNLAISQLEERVERCRRLREAASSQEDSPSEAAKAQSAIAREAIAFARLSLCYTAQGDIKKAIDAALKCQVLSKESGDPAKLAFSRFFYGRTLLLNGQKKEALEQFNPSDGYTPVAVLCKEPSEEHRGYIREMIDAGADLTLRDKSGYSALDYAVYSGDGLTQELLIETLRREHSNEVVEQHRLESVLRKGYRELFQEELRPVLLQAGKQLSIKKLRRVYARTLAMDAEKARQFDVFKYVRFSDFVQCGRLPKSDDNLTRRIEDDLDEDVFVIFISYRWAKKMPGEDFSPDDAQNSRHQRMVKAVESFLEAHPDVDPKKVGVWIDWACIDQVDRDVQARGIAALPMCITQCNAMISIVDKVYWERAWCCVEVVTIQSLRRSYNAHWWFEYDYDAAEGKGVLREGKLDVVPNVASAKVTLESDRPKLMFLERQANLLG